MVKRHLAKGSIDSTGTRRTDEKVALQDLNWIGDTREMVTSLSVTYPCPIARETARTTWIPLSCGRLSSLRARKTYNVHCKGYEIQRVEFLVNLRRHTFPVSYPFQRLYSVHSPSVAYTMCSSGTRRSPLPCSATSRICLLVKVLHHLRKQKSRSASCCS